MERHICKRRIFNFFARTGAVALVVASQLWSITAAFAVTIPVICQDPAGNDVTVGDIEVDVKADGTGVTGGFSAVSTLAAAAAFCHEDHFNWFQAILSDNMPLNDSKGNPLMPPYMDPPLGGYGPPDTQWGDGLPWYWDEGADPPAGTDGFEDGYNLADNISLDGKTLGFADCPGGADGTKLEFATWLVSLNANGTLHSFHDGFLWKWSNSVTDPNGTAVMGQHIPALLGQQMYNRLVPEPSSWALAVIGLVMCVYGQRRRCRV